MNKEIVFATKNKGKVVEIKEILEDFNVLTLDEAGISIDVIEDGTTFEENSYKKAYEIMKASNKITMADDSGIEIDFLDKAPGVYSARYLGEDTPYDVKNAKILEMLKDVPLEKRTARFVCVITTCFLNGEKLVSRGTIEGHIAFESKGENGFGYDPIFFVPEHNMTTAQMPKELKNSISHRGKALEEMKKLLDGKL